MDGKAIQCQSKRHLDLTDWRLTDWLTDWLIDPLTDDSLTIWLPACPANGPGLTHRLTDWGLSGWSFGATPYNMEIHTVASKRSSGARHPSRTVRPPSPWPFFQMFSIHHVSDFFWFTACHKKVHPRHMKSCNYHTNGHPKFRSHAHTHTHPHTLMLRAWNNTLQDDETRNAVGQKMPRTSHFFTYTISLKGWAITPFCFDHKMPSGQRQMKNLSHKSSYTWS